MTLLFCTLVGWQYSKVVQVEGIEKSNYKIDVNWEEAKEQTSKISIKIKNYASYLSTSLLSGVDEIFSNRDKQKGMQGEQPITDTDPKAMTSANNSTNSVALEGKFLDVPIVSQLPELPSGCEITAVAMMLQYSGATVNKITLANEMPKHTSNPNLGYVGDPFKTSGYTINPSALVELTKKYAGSAVDLTGSDTSILENYLQSNKPVVVWLQSHGYTVHAVTLCGYNDKNFYYNDPLTGWKRVAIDKETFQAKWKAKNRMALSY
jgi:uncharacterized protein YvpB